MGLSSLNYQQFTPTPSQEIWCQIINNVGRCNCTETLQPGILNLRQMCEKHWCGGTGTLFIVIYLFEHTLLQQGTHQY